MRFLKKILSLLFLFFMIVGFWQCARRGSPTGGDKDITPPVLIKADPKNLSTNFNKKIIRLTFDEFITLEDVQNQLVISPPLKYIPKIRPQGTTSKFVEITFKDTLRENTTYTINFGQSIVDNNEGNPNRFLTYVFSTGDLIDSLSISGVVKDAYNKKADEFISVMLYEIDSVFNDSTIYKYPPNYITNTLDSLPLFSLKNLKEGKYHLIALKDETKNNVFDQNSDKIGFLADTISLPSDSLFLLNLFKEIPDYSISVPSYAAKNKIIFGYKGPKENFKIEPLTVLPDSVKSVMLKDRENDSINYWLTPTDIDSILFTVTNEKLGFIDTFTVKNRKLPLDSLRLTPSPSSRLNFEDTFKILANTPIQKIDTSKIAILDQDTIQKPFSVKIDILKNNLDFNFEVNPNERYNVVLLPGAIEDFFGMQNDTIITRLSTNGYADYGNLTLNLSGELNYPIIVELTDERDNLIRQLIAKQPQAYDFRNLDPKNYRVRIIFDENDNGKWDTGSYLNKLQPERIIYYPDLIEIRANWEKNETFFIRS